MPGDYIIPTPGGHRLRRGSVVPNGARARGRLEVGRGAIVLGGILLDGSLLTEPRVRIDGSIRAVRAVIGARSRVLGHIHCEADLHLLPGVQVAGDVHAEAEIHIHDGVHVQGAVHAGGDLVVHGPARTGPISTGGRTATRYGSRTPRSPQTPALQGETRSKASTGSKSGSSERIRSHPCSFATATWTASLGRRPMPAPARLGSPNLQEPIPVSPHPWPSPSS